MNTTSDPRPTIAVVGLRFGRHIVEQVAAGSGRPHLRLVGLCDLERDKAEALSVQHGGVPVYASLDAILADPAIRTVGLFTGPVGRAELLRKIICAGRDVITTKPFELDVAAAEAVLREAAERGRVIHLNSPNPGTSPDLAQILRWQEELQLGRAVAARAETWVSYREQPDGSWYDDPQRCPVAPLFRLGIYLINDLVRLMGRVQRVSVFSSRIFTGRPTPDNAQLSLMFESGALANILASFCVRDGDHYRNSLTVNYADGTVYREVGPHRQVSADAAELTAVVADGPPDALRRRVAASACLPMASGRYDWEGFARAVNREAGAPGYTFEHILEPIRVIGAMAEAERTGTVVEIPRPVASGQ